MGRIMENGKWKMENGQLKIENLQNVNLEPKHHHYKLSYY